MASAYVHSTNRFCGLFSYFLDVDETKFRHCVKLIDTTLVRVGRGSGPSIGRVGSQNSLSWVGRVGSSVKISTKYAIYMQEIRRLKFIMIKSCIIAFLLSFTYLFHFGYLVAVSADGDVWCSYDEE